DEMRHRLVSDARGDDRGGDVRLGPDVAVLHRAFIRGWRGDFETVAPGWGTTAGPDRRKRASRSYPPPPPTRAVGTGMAGPPVKSEGGQARAMTSSGRGCRLAAAGAEGKEADRAAANAARRRDGAAGDAACRPRRAVDRALDRVHPCICRQRKSGDQK